MSPSIIILGLYIVFVIGIKDPKTHPLEMGMQMFGLLISIISLTKGVAEYQITDAHSEDSSGRAMLKSIVFILPHTMVRVVSYALIAGFFKYYSFIPAALILFTNTMIAILTARKHSDDPYNSLLFVTLLAGLCTPFCLGPKSVSHHSYLRRSLLSTNLFLLACLLFLFFLPSIFHPAVLVKTPGLGHLRFESLFNATHSSVLDVTGR